MDPDHLGPHCRRQCRAHRAARPDHRDVDHVLENYDARGFSRSTGKPCVFGYTPDGRFIVVIYEEVDDETILPVTAYEVPEP